MTALLFALIPGYCIHWGVRNPLWAQLLIASFGKEAPVPLCVRCEHVNIQVNGQKVPRTLFRDITVRGGGGGGEGFVDNYCGRRASP